MPTRMASAMKIGAVLVLLRSLKIFEKGGVRRFVKLENSEIENCTRHVKNHKGEITEKTIQLSTSPLKQRRPISIFVRGLKKANFN